MASKPTKITDVASPGETAPDATSRPMLANRAVLASDPVMVSAPAAAEPQSSPVAPHSDKVIAPVSQTPSAQANTGNAAPVSELTAVASQAVGADTDEADPISFHQDTEAEQAAAEATAETARAERAEALEQLIASGTYAVPINATGRKRSHMLIILACFVAIVLALIVVDVLLDMGTIKLAIHLPHTKFLSK